ncbi:MAG: MFS transporter [Chloroflexota bacterium]
MAHGMIPPSTPVEGPQPGTFAALRFRDFRLLWMGHFSHSLALWMEQTALPLFVLDLTGSGAHLGGVLAVRTVPQLLFGLIAGVVSDMFDRRQIMLMVKTTIFIMYSIFALALLAGRVELWHVYLLAFGRGSLMAFDQPARQSLIPTLVPAEMLTSAVALMTATTNVMRILGASAGGLTVAAIGTGGAFSAVAIIYLGAVTATYLMHIPPLKKQADRGVGAMRSGLMEGARFAFAHSGIRGVILLALVYFTFGMSYMQVFAPLFAKDVLDIGDAGYGFMLSVSGGGALVGALFIARRQPTRLGVVLPLTVAVFGTLLIAFSFSTYVPDRLGRTWIVLPFAIIALVGTMQTAFFSLSNAALLHMSPPDLRGRVISLLSLDRAMITAGAAAAGLFAEWQGVQVAQTAYGAICLVGGLAVFILAREFRTADTSVAPPAASERASVAPEPTTTASR